MLDRSSPPSDPTPEKSNIVVIDESDDEDLLSPYRSSQKRKKRSTSPTKPLSTEGTSNLPKKSSAHGDHTFLQKEFRKWTLPETSEDEDTRPWKRISPSKPRNVIHKKIHRPVENSDEDTDADEFGSDKLSSPATSNSSERNPKISIRSTVSSTPRQDLSKSLNEVTDAEFDTDHEDTSSDSEKTDNDSDSPDLDELFSASIPIRPKRVPRKPDRSRGNLDDDVLKNRIETKTTPWIRRLAGALFNRTLQSAEAERLDGEEKEALIDLTSGKGSLPHQAWEDKPMKDFSFLGDPIRKDREIGRDFYSAVEVNGNTYRIGDFCLVRPDDQHAGNSLHSSNLEVLC